TDPITRMPGFSFLDNLWGIDNFWNRAGASGMLAAGRVVAWFDRNIVDGAMNGIGWLCGRARGFLLRTSNGQAQAYAGVFIGATVVIALLLIFCQNQFGGHITGLQRSASSIRLPERTATGVRGR